MPSILQVTMWEREIKVKPEEKCLILLKVMKTSTQNSVRNIDQKMECLFYMEKNPSAHLSCNKTLLYLISRPTLITKVSENTISEFS